MTENAADVHIPAPARRVGGLDAAAERPVLLAAGGFRMGPGLSREVHCIESWMFEFFLTGRLDLHVGGAGWRTAGQGQGVLYPPRTPFCERLPRGCAECTSFSLFFNDGGYAPLLQRIGRAPRAWWVDDPDRAMIRLVTEIERAVEPSPASDLLLSGCFSQFVAHLVRGEMTDDTIVVRTGGVDEPVFVTRAHQYMRDHLGQAIRLADLAAYTGFSESGFSHAYRRATGRSPMAVLRSMRVEAARMLLHRSRLSLQGIAEQTGFADAFHLSRTFKQVTDVSPSDYRRSAGE